MSQLKELATALRADGLTSEYLSNLDRAYITVDERHLVVVVANDGRDKFYELRDESGLLTTIDIPVDLDLLVDQITEHLV